MTEGNGNTTMNSVIARQVAKTAITEFIEQYPEMKPKPDMPPPLKWIGAIGALVLGAAVIGYFNWLTGAVNQMQVTMARMDERQQGQIVSAEGRYADLDRRVGVLESYHRNDR